uniref:Ribosomal RNA small subunit methyltransferase I n=1 Tax=candidate division WOR-3 bacterium TaxID=2052148 RepID=A0A7C4U6Z9_UNCW3
MMFFVSGPIGNLKDITLRAIDILSSVDYIVCEDTRRTSKLLKAFDIKKSLVSYNEYNENKRIPEILKDLKDGKNIAFITDSGTPIIQDPGLKLVKSLIKENIPFTSIPGPSSITNAIVLSGIDCRNFIFYGFIGKKKSERKSFFESIKKEKRAVIFFESPYRIKDTIEIMKDVIPERNIAVLREMTKVFEERISGKPEDVLRMMKKIKGEFVVVVEGFNEPR